MDRTAGATRSPRITKPENAAKVRRLHCRFYNACLDLAVENGWPGFTCEACEVDAHQDAMREKEDLRGLLEVLVEAKVTRVAARG
jgi:hypothetical protein